MSSSPQQTVIYLPGLDGTGRLLYRQTALAEQYNLLCQSYPQDRPHTYEEVADAAADRLQMEGCQRAIVLAESFGGAVAIYLTLRHPQLVERMILINTFAYYPARARIRLVSWLGKRFPKRPSPRSSRRVRGFFFFGRDISRDEQNQWWEYTADVPMKAFGNRLQLIAKLDLRWQLENIDTPALVLAAPDDRVVPPSAGKELARLMPAARLIERRVGHAAMIHPDIDIARWICDPTLWPTQDETAAS